MARKTESELVREALEAYLSADPAPASAYELASALGLIGSAPGASKDLSTNRRHFSGFGTSS